MANTNTSPNMNITVPNPTVQTGPQWATNIYNALYFTIDAHDHTPGNGAPLSASSIFLSSDLPFNGNNATLLRSVRFQPQTSPLALSTDIGALYEAGVDLYYNDGNGNQIRITQSGAIAGAAGTITGLPSGTASASYQSGTGTFVFQQATSTAANIDVGSVIVRPTSASAPGVTLSAPTGLASGFTLTLPGGLPASNALVTLSTAGALSATLTPNVQTLNTGTLSVTSTAVVQGTSDLQGAITVETNAVLQSSGSKQLLISGNFPVITSPLVPSNGGLVIVRGYIASNGIKQFGEGFASANPSTGVYNVVYSTAFSDTPSVFVTINANPTITTYTYTISNQTTTGCTVNMVVGGALGPSAFNFMAIGPR